MDITNQNQRTALIILGMHRSGTSALAGVLNILGLSMGTKLMAPHAVNPKGFFEDVDLYALNEDLLNLALGSRWDDPEPKALGFIPDEYYQRAARLIDEKFSGLALFGMKDPRNSILFPFWRRVLESNGIIPKVIVLFRDPNEVASSLLDRDHFFKRKGIVLWAKHYLSSEYHSRALTRVFISFADLLAQSKETVHKIESLLDITFPRSWNEVGKEVNNFLSGELKHHDTPTVDYSIYSDSILRLVRMAKDRTSLAVSDEPQWRTEIDQINREYLFWSSDQELRSWNIKKHPPAHITLQNPTTIERLVLTGSWEYSENQAVLTFDNLVNGYSIASITPGLSPHTKMRVITLRGWNLQGEELSFREEDWHSSSCIKNGDWWYVLGPDSCLWFNIPISLAKYSLVLEVQIITPFEQERFLSSANQVPGPENLIKSLLIEELMVKQNELVKNEQLCTINIAHLQNTMAQNEQLYIANLEKLQNDLTQANSQYEHIVKSASYRLGRIVTYPIRKIKAFFWKIKS